MARPLKQGLDYYPMDVDFYRDIKIRRLNHALGVESTVILLALYGAIYKDQGYFVRWTEDLCFSVAMDCECTEEQVTVVLEKTLTLGIFEQSCYETYGVLTSRGIQKRYLAATYKRKQVTMVAAYFLVPKAARPNLCLVASEDVEESQEAVAEEVVMGAVAETATSAATGSAAEVQPVVQSGVHPAAKPAVQSTIPASATSCPKLADDSDPNRQPNEQAKVQADKQPNEQPNIQLDNQASDSANEQPTAQSNQSNQSNQSASPTTSKVAVFPGQWDQKLRHTETYQAWCVLWQEANLLLQKEIARLINQYSDSLVSAAVQIAAEKQVRREQALSFVKSCLQEWQQAGVQGMDEVQAYQNQRNQSRRESASATQRRSAATTLRQNGWGRTATPNSGTGQNPWQTPASDPAFHQPAPKLDRQTWLQLQKECYLLMGEDYQPDDSFHKPPRRSWPGSRNPRQTIKIRSSSKQPVFLRNTFVRKFPGEGVKFTAAGSKLSLYLGKGRPWQGKIQGTSLSSWRNFMSLKLAKSGVFQGESQRKNVFHPGKKPLRQPKLLP